MNKNLLNIYKLYNLENFYYLQKIKNNLNSIKNNFNNITNYIKSYTYIYTLENDFITDISLHIIQKLIQNHNINIIHNQQNNKYINLLQIQTFKDEYYFKTNIQFKSSLYLKILEVINTNFHFIFILDPKYNTPIGIRKNNDFESTLFQFHFFGKKLEECLNNKLNIILHDHEINALFINTNYNTFPTIYFVYEARNYVLTNLLNISQVEYLQAMVKYVRNKGYVVNIHRQNNQYVMGLVH